MEQLISAFGLLCMLAIGFALSSARKSINWKTVISGIVLQILFGLIILKTGFGRAVFEQARELFTGLLNFTNEGSKFIFGPLTNLLK